MILIFTELRWYFTSLLIGRKCWLVFSWQYCNLQSHLSKVLQKVYTNVLIMYNGQFFIWWPFCDAQSHSVHKHLLSIHLLFEHRMDQHYSKLPVGVNASAKGCLARISRGTTVIASLPVCYLFLTLMKALQQLFLWYKNEISINTSLQAGLHAYART